MAKNERSITEFDAIRLAVANEEDILSWSYGEVLKPETINYRTQKPERDGLFCERIFGPVKDINPHDAKLKGVRSREAAVDKNGDLVTKSSSRRERMGHIKLATPVAHIWFMRGAPNAMGTLLGLTAKSLEKIAYFQSYVILSANEEKINELKADNEAQFEAGRAAIKMRYEKAANNSENSEDNNNAIDVRELSSQMNRELEDLTDDYNEKKTLLDSFVKGALMREKTYRDLPEEYDELIEVGMGGSALRQLLEEIDIDQLIADLSEQAEAKKVKRRRKFKNA